MWNVSMSDLPIVGWGGVERDDTVDATVQNSPGCLRDVAPTRALRYMYSSCVVLAVICGSQLRRVLPVPVSWFVVDGCLPRHLI